MVSGINLSVINLFMFYFASSSIKKSYSNLNNFNSLTYYWLCFTVMTGIWELFFVLNYKSIMEYSMYLINNDLHVWASNYNLSFLMPNKFSYIFYAEYGAYADREYMSRDNWSRVIESTHSILCGIFSFCALLSIKNNMYNKFLLTLGISMGSQLMNSILYLFNYFYETHQPYSINYDSDSFPCGYALLERPFMYINVFWFIMPSLILLYNLTNYHSISFKKINI